jgi:hypothetical protein
LFKGLELTHDLNDVPSGYDPDIVWEGLGFVPFALALHYKSDHPESESVDREIAFYEASGIPYRTLPDGEVLIVDGHGEEIAGSPMDAEGHLRQLRHPPGKRGPPSKAEGPASEVYRVNGTPRVPAGLWSLL